MRQFLYNALKLEEFCPVPKPCPVVKPSPPPPPPATLYKTITQGTLIQKLPYTVDNPQGNGGTWSVRKTFWDLEYGLTTKEKIEEFFAWDRLDEEKYILDDRDCNRFAVSLWGRIGLWTPNLLFGLILTGNHAMNWFMDKDYVRWTVEPQNDYTKIQGDNSKAYHYFA